MNARQYHNILYSCEEYHKRSNEQLIQEHAFGYLVSGETRVQTSTGAQVYKAGTIGLLRKNQLAKSIKVPQADGTPFKSINIFLEQDVLKRYGAETNIHAVDKYTGEPMIDLSDDPFIRNYFESLLLYFDQPCQLTTAMAELKTREAIELLLRSRPDLKNLLFDFSEPFKIDLEAFMNQHYTYNIPLAQFARLTGRSLATFKRDFSKVFSLPPERWLHQKRLQHAHFLIKEERQAPGNAYIDAGFENLSHFSAAFKKYYGYNPSSLRADL